jgi:hypothetical protein
VAALAERLAMCEKGAHGLNAFLVSNLVDLDGREALSAMEAAFEEGCVDETVGGGWRDVQRRFGLEPLRGDRSEGHVPGHRFAPPRDPRPDPSRGKAKRKKKLARASRQKNRKKR